MTNFFERQRQARRLTWLLGLVFMIAFVAIILFTAAWSSILFEIPFKTVMPIASIAVLVIVIIATLYRALTLMTGGAKVAMQLGATRLPEETSDTKIKRLRNVVEEIAIASSTPVPDVFILEESGINAFASGYSTADAAITVTRGALNALNRDELQAVIAHEFSHITNGDMRLSTQLVSALFGISVIGLIGMRILRMRLRGKNSGGIYIFAFGLIVIGYAGLFANRIIKACINRQREYLADASAVQFTRQNVGLAGALKKIAGVSAGSIIRNEEASEFSHMFFSQGFSFASLFATHPPILTRIQLLDPQFKLEAMTSLRQQWLQNPPDGEAEDLALGLAARVAAPDDDDDYHRAQLIIDELPPSLLRASRNYYGVIPLLFGLVYSEDPAVRAKQQTLISSRHSKKTLENTEALLIDIQELNRSQRLPLAILAFPALRQYPKDKLDKLIETLNLLVNADERVSLFEYLFTHLLSITVNDFLNPTGVLHEGQRTIKSNAIAVSTIIAVMASVGRTSMTAANAAYQAGMAIALPNANIPYEAITAYAKALDPAWVALDGLNLAGKERLLEALVITLQHDNVITQEESDLLRAMAASLHIPLPMLSPENFKS